MLLKEDRFLVPRISYPTYEIYAKSTVLSKEEGGRHTPFFKGYRPQFYFRTTDVTGEVKPSDGVEMVMPGDTVDELNCEPHSTNRHGRGFKLCC